MLRRDFARLIRSQGPKECPPLSAMGNISGASYPDILFRKAHSHMGNVRRSPREFSIIVVLRGILYHDNSFQVPGDFVLHSPYGKAAGR